MELAIITSWAKLACDASEITELESLLGMFSLIVDLHYSVFALNILWVLLNSLLLDVFDLLHERMLLMLDFDWSCS